MLKRSFQSKLALIGAATLCMAASAHAQNHVVPGSDVVLGDMTGIDHFGSNGTNTTAGFAVATTICNNGTQTIPWFAPMNANHPIITFLIAREMDGRMEQISNRSYVKHGFFALASSQCTPCNDPMAGGTVLGLGCSDTYGTGNNGDNFWLGPPGEIDPFHGTWDPFCSLFDLGLSGTTCDGNRSFNGTGLGPVGNRMRIRTANLNQPGATYWMQGYYVVKEEAEADRHNNFLSQRVTITPGAGSNWNASAFAHEPNRNKSVLERWIDGPNPANTLFEGISSNANVVGTTTLDGRVYVAYQITEPSPGVYHYEYAIHNRDNARGVGSFELPLCPGASITNFGTSDATFTNADDWTATVSADDTTLVMTDGSASGNYVHWNTIINVWFDSNAAPVFDDGTLVAGDPGPGNDEFVVKLFVPGNTCQAALIPYGCVANDCDMTVTGLPDLGAPVNFELDNPALTQSSGVGVLNISVDPPALYPCGVNVPVLGGEFLMGPTILEPFIYPGVWTPSNPVNFTLPIPPNPALAGVSLYTQSFIVELGPVLIKPSEGVRMVVGP